ncbi:MAG: hypothetical protein ACOCP8_03115 [archaeon]
MGIIFFLISIGIGLMFLNFIWELIKFICEMIYIGWFKRHRRKNIIEPLRENETVQRKIMEEKMLEAEEENKHKEQILAKQNRIIEAGLSRTRELRIRFPLANEELFKTYLKKFPTYSIDEIENIEDEIKASHLNNEIKFTSNPPKKKNYTLNDLNDKEPLEEYKEKPLIMRIYKINSDYLLYIRDLDRDEVQLLQSKDYLVLSRTIIRILDKQKILKRIKSKVKAKEINSIFNNVEGAVSRYRGRF